MSEIVLCQGPANQVGVRVMYILYRLDGFDRLKSKYQFYENTHMSLFKKDNADVTLQNVFKDIRYKDENQTLFISPEFNIDGKQKYCNGIWYSKSEESEGNPDIKVLKSILEDCYKGVLRIEGKGEWYLYGPENFKKEYLDGVVFESKLRKIKKAEEKTEDVLDSNEWASKIDNTTEGYADSQESQSHPLNLILYGPPGTGKSYTAKQIVKGDAKDDKTCKELKLDNMSAGKSVRVTFHPDTDYASFVGCYKPSMNDKEEIVYKFVPQAFLKIYVDAWKNLISDEKTDEKKQYYLVIEELNRGNCAQIFGDIFQLLDRNDEGYSDYYIWADTDVVKYLKSEEGFGNDYEKYCKKLENIFKELKDADKKDWGVLALPSNLTILATMNTSDQSLFPIDSAFKRRWEWKYVRINYDAVDLKDVKLWNGTTKWLDFIEAINKYIADKTHSADKQIGERFVKPINGKIDYATFRDKVMFYLFNDVFKDDVEFGREVSGGASANEVFLFENLFEFEKTGKSNIENFIAKLL